MSPEGAKSPLTPTVSHTTAQGRELTDRATVLHNQFYVIHNNRLLEIWPLTARGRLT